MADAKKQFKEIIDFLDGVVDEGVVSEVKREGSSPLVSKRFSVKQSDYIGYLKSAGVPKDVPRQLADANRNYHNANIAFASEVLCKDKKLDRVSINTRTPGGVIVVRVNRAGEVNNPKSGDRVTKYGMVSLKVGLKSGLDKGLLDQCSAEVEKASK